MDLNEARVLNTIYGNYDKTSKSSKWLVKEDSIIKKFYKKEKFYLYTSIKFIIDTINFKGKRCAIIVTQSKPENYDCHPCAPLVGIILLEKINNEWVIKYNNYLDLIGTWGEIPIPKLELIGEHKYGISFEIGFTGQGYTNIKYILFEIQQDKIRKILVIDDFAEDNEGICDKSLNNCWEYSSNYYFKKSSKSEFFDLIVNSSGTKLENNKINSFKLIKFYKYVNGKYSMYKTIQ
jgi:hypothetical protein